MDHKIPTVRNSDPMQPTDPRIYLGEISARYSDARLLPMPGITHKMVVSNLFYKIIARGFQRQIWYTHVDQVESQITK